MPEWDADDSEANYLFKSRLADHLTEKCLTVQEGAGRLNVPSARLYKYLNLGIPNPLPAYLLPNWTLRIGPEPMEYLNHEAHRGSAELPRVLPDWDDAIDLGSQVMRECGGVLELYAKSLKDGEITLRQFQQIQRAVQNGISTLLGVQLVAETMIKMVPKPGRGPTA